MLMMTMEWMMMRTAALSAWTTPERSSSCTAATWCAQLHGNLSWIFRDRSAFSLHEAVLISSWEKWHVKIGMYKKSMPRMSCR